MSTSKIPVVEAHCVRPGHWVIGGFEVHRLSERPPHWEISRNGRFVASAGSLSEARELITSSRAIDSV